MDKMVRINTRISQTMNNWLDEQSRITGLSKSSIMMMAAENYKREKEAFGMMADIGQLVTKIDELERTIKRDPQ